MMECQCIRRTDIVDDWVKVSMVDREPPNYRIVYRSGSGIASYWVESIQHMTDRIENGIYRVAACDECTHQLACLVDPEAERLFETKV